MNTPTHLEVSQRAHQIWQDSGCPDGRDTEFWLEAERQLTGNAKEIETSKPQVESVSSTEKPKTENAASFAKRVQGETASESAAEFHISPTPSEQKAIQAAVQKQDARAPKVSHKNAPKAQPAETGKPLWSQPHSS